MAGIAKTAWRASWAVRNGLIGRFLKRRIGATEPNAAPRRWAYGISRLSAAADHVGPRLRDMGSHHVHART